MSWAARNLPGVYFNLMFQYRPEYRAALYPEIDRRPSQQEKMGAVEAARRHGIALS